MSVYQFFENVITEPMRDFLCDAHTMAFMMVCGGLAKYEEPQASVLEVAKT